MDCPKFQAVPFGLSPLKLYYRVLLLLGKWRKNIAEIGDIYVIVTMIEISSFMIVRFLVLPIFLTLKFLFQMEQIYIRFL